MQLTKKDKNLIKWIEALISERYTQHSKEATKHYGMLYDPKTDCYCALGVAAKALGALHFGKYFFFFGFNDRDTAFSRLYVQPNWFYKRFNPGIDVSRVSYMSDYTHSFAEIAVYLCGFLPPWPDEVETLNMRVLNLAAEERIARENMTKPTGFIDLKGYKIKSFSLGEQKRLSPLRDL